MENDNISKDLTLILILKDRTPFTWRWFDFYNKHPLPYKTLIADGGSDPSLEKLKDHSLYPNVNYEYIRYPYDADINTFFQKIYDAVSRVKTNYVVFASNDDFIMGDSLKNAVNFLNKNPDYVMARGDILSFELRPTNKSEIQEDVWGTIVNIQKNYKNTSNMADTALERIRIFSEYSNSLWHDVSRTNELKQCHKTLLASGIVDLRHTDQLIGYLISAIGKIHRGQYLYMLHQGHSGELGLALSKRDAFKWMMSESWPQEVSRLFDIVANQVSMIDKIPVNEARYKVMQYYICYPLGQNMIANTIRKSLKRPPVFVRMGRIFDKDNAIRIFIKRAYLFMGNLHLLFIKTKSEESSLYKEEIAAIQEFLNTHI